MSANNDWKEWSQHVLIELTRLNDGQSNISAKISSIDVTLAGQAVELKEHIRRTTAVEANVALLESKAEMQRQELANSLVSHKDLSTERYLEQKFKQEKMSDDIQAINDIPAKISRVAKWITTIAAASGVIFSFLKFIVKVI